MNIFKQFSVDPLVTCSVVRACTYGLQKIWLNCPHGSPSIKKVPKNFHFKTNFVPFNTQFRHLSMATPKVSYHLHTFFIVCKALDFAAINVTVDKSKWVSKWPKIIIFVKHSHLKSVQPQREILISILIFKKSCIIKSISL